jgi:hypothetical protein
MLAPNPSWLFLVDRDGQSRWAAPPERKRVDWHVWQDGLMLYYLAVNVQGGRIGSRVYAGDYVE